MKDLYPETMTKSQNLFPPLLTKSLGRRFRGCVLPTQVSLGGLVAVCTLPKGRFGLQTMRWKLGLH